MKAHDHETLHVGRLSVLDVHGLSGIFIFGCVAPQAHAASFFLLPLNLRGYIRGLKSHDHETWHVGPLSDVDEHGLSGILIFDRVPPQAHAT